MPTATAWSATGRGGERWASRPLQSPRPVAHHPSDRLSGPANQKNKNCWMSPLPTTFARRRVFDLTVDGQRFEMVLPTPVGGHGDD